MELTRMRLIRYLIRLIRFPYQTSIKVDALAMDMDVVKNLHAKILINEIRRGGIRDNIHDVEFKVYSQWGDDGIIQYLIHNIDIPQQSRKFVEFGVQDYRESTTRFLLVNNYWKGLIMDSGAGNIEFIMEDDIYWKFDLTARVAFVDAENIDNLLRDNGFSGEIGLLHIDIDGNDYWVWKGITAVNPIIVVVEYNSVFGCDRAVTIPYTRDFDRTQAHHSNLYFGASLKALCMLAEEKGYCFVGSSSSGNNAYFVRRDKVGEIPVLTVRDGYVKSVCRESRGPDGNLTYISGDDRLSEIGGMNVYDLESDCVVKLIER